MLTIRRSAILILMFCGVALFTGCREDIMTQLTDASSRARLEAMPDAMTLLLSLHGTDLPEIVENTRPLGSLDGARLIETPRDDLDRVTSLPGLERVVVWGGVEAASRLDPLLRLDLLSRLHDPERTAEALPVIGTFNDGPDDLTDALTALGVVVGSRSGDIVTFEAAPEVLLELLARDDLRKLEKPSLMQPSTNANTRIEP